MFAFSEVRASLEEERVEVAAFEASTDTRKPQPYRRGFLDLSVDQALTLRSAGWSISLLML
jgi:hypothetical protein